MKKHDENKDVRLLSQIAKINPITKTISIPKNINIGNRRWGRIDFLVNYLHYVLVREGNVINNSSNVFNKSFTDVKKQKQERKRNAKVEEKKQIKSKKR